MESLSPGNGLRWKVDNHEERLRKIEAFELAVMLRRLDDIDQDIRDLRSQLRWQTRTLIGAMVTMVFTLAIALLVFPHG